MIDYGEDFDPALTLHDLLPVCTDFELHIIGEGIDGRYLEDQDTHLGMKDSVVSFQGFVADETFAESVRNADFFLRNSRMRIFRCLYRSTGIGYSGSLHLVWRAGRIYQ